MFKGDSQKDRYFSTFKSVINSIDNNIDLGASRDDLGTHSVRKAADTYAVNMPCGPTSTVVKLRAGHSLGTVQDCYQKEDASGDCFCGRVLSGITLLNENFAILPPHFHPDALTIIETQIGWNNILDGYNNYPASFKRIIPYMLATLVYHYYNGNLHKLLPNAHPIFKQKLFTLYITELKAEYVLLGIDE